MPYTPDLEQSALVEHALELFDCAPCDLAPRIGVSRQHLSNVRRCRFRLSAEPLDRLRMLIATAPLAEREVGR